MEKRTPFYQQQTYHIYNCSNGSEPLFRCDQNYEFFLKRYHLYMDTWWDTHAWSLMPGEFHFIVSVRLAPANVNELSKAISRAFGDFSNCYVQAYNKHHKRKGSLLRRAFKREMVFRPGELRNLTCYMHNLPVAAQLVAAPQDWRYSSYTSLASATEEEFLRHPLLRLFGSRQEFVRRHNTQFGEGSIALGYVPAA